MSKTVKVILPVKTRPGLVACGNYRVGKEYEVSVDEAARLVRYKGFEATNAADQKTIKTAIDAAEKATAAAGNPAETVAATEEK